MAIGWPPIVASLIAAAAAAVVLSPPRTSLELVAMTCGCTFVALVPRSWLPCVGLLLFALVPTVYLRGVPDSVGRYLSPAIFMIGAFCVRSMAQRVAASKGAVWWGLISAITAIWLVESYRVSIEPRRSLTWMVVFVFGVLAPGFAARRESGAHETLLRGWTWLAVALGLFGLFEGITHVNPLAHHYTVQGVAIGQTWSVYRIETTLGHPLLNGLFFATTAALMTMRAVKQPSVFRVSAALLSTTALALTASRSGVIAFVAGVGLSVCIMMLRREASVGKKLVTLFVAVLVLLAVVNAPILKERERSSEASVSALYRSEVISTSLGEMRRYHYLGSGAGTSQILFLRDGQNPSLENSVLQIGVSLGIPGLIALGLIVLTVGTSAVRRGRLEVLAGLVAYVIAAAGFNPWDSDPQTFALLGLLTILALSPSIRTPAESDPLPADAALG